MSAQPPPGTRAILYRRYSTDRMNVSPTEALRPEIVEFDPAQAAIVRRIYADYAAGLSPLAIAQALNNANRGGDA